MTKHVCTSTNETYQCVSFADKQCSQKVLGKSFKIFEKPQGSKKFKFYYYEEPWSNLVYTDFS